MPIAFSNVGLQVPLVTAPTVRAVDKHRVTLRGRCPRPVTSKPDEPPVRPRSLCADQHLAAHEVALLRA